MLFNNKSPWYICDYVNIFIYCTTRNLIVLNILKNKFRCKDDNDLFSNNISHLVEKGKVGNAANGLCTSQQCSNVLRQNSADGWKIYSGWKCFLFQLEFDASKKLTLYKQCCWMTTP